jgi:hypothetical protein
MVTRALLLVLLLAAGAIPAKAHANEIETRLSRARSTLSSQKNLSVEERRDLDRKLSRAEQAWHRVKEIAQASGIEAPDITPEIENEFLALPAVVALEIAIGAVLLAAVAYAIARFVIPDQVISPVDYGRALDEVREQISDIVESLKRIAGKPCSCTCLGKAKTGSEPDPHHGDRNVGKVSHAADCRAECVFRGFSSYQCL